MSNNANEKFVITALFDGSNAVKQAGQAANDINQQFGGKDLTGGLGDKFSAVTDILGGMGPAAAAASAAIGVAFAGISSAMDFADQINGIREMSAAAGMLPQQFEATAKALQMTGWNAEEASDKLKDINERFGEFRTTGQGALADVMKSWNILASDLTSTDPIENLNTIVNKMKQQGATAEQIHFAMGEIVDDGQVLSQVLGENYGQYQKSKDAALATTKATDENVAAAKRWKEEVSQLESNWNKLGSAIGSAILPLLNDILDGTNDWIQKLIDGRNYMNQIKADQNDRGQDGNITSGSYMRPNTNTGSSNGEFTGGDDYMNAGGEGPTPQAVNNNVYRQGYFDDRAQLRLDEMNHDSAARNQRQAEQAQAEQTKGAKLFEAKKRIETLKRNKGIADNYGDDAKAFGIQKDIDSLQSDIDLLEGSIDEVTNKAEKASINARKQKEAKGSKGSKSPIQEANEAYEKGIAENKRLLQQNEITQQEYAQREQTLLERKRDAIGEAQSKLTGQTYVSYEDRKKLVEEWNAFYANNIQGEGDELQRQLGILQVEHAKQEQELERHLKAQLDAKLMSEQQAQEMRDQLAASQNNQTAGVLDQQLGIDSSAAGINKQLGNSMGMSQDQAQGMVNNTFNGMEAASMDKYQRELASAQDNYAKIQAAKEAHENEMDAISRRRNAASMIVEQKYQQEKNQMMNNGFNTAISLTQAFGKKGAKIARALVLAQTIFNQWQAISSGYAAIALAAASAPPPFNVPAIAMAKANFAFTVAGAVGAVAGAAAAPEGQAHDGLDSIPKDGTWNLQAGERVVDKRLNRDLKDYLYSSNGTNKSRGDANVTVHAGITIQGDANGDIEDKMHEWADRNKESITGMVNEQMGRLGYR